MNHSRHCVVGCVSRRCGSVKLPSSRPLSSSPSLVFKHELDDYYIVETLHVQRGLLRTYNSMSRMQSTCINEILSPGSRRYFSSSSSSSSSIDLKKSNNTNNRRRIVYHYHGDDSNNGNNNNLNLLQFSKLKPRQSAEIEDELYTRLLNDDNRLLDPILKTSITTLNWLKSISVPSSSSLVASSTSNQHHNDNNSKQEEKDSIIVTIEPPTLLHPKLYELASNVATVVREEIVSLLTETMSKDRQNQQQYATWLKQQLSEDGIETHQVGVTVVFSPKSTCSPYQSTTASHQSTFKSFTINNYNNNQQQQPHSSTTQSKALQNITHFLAVYSCKGGVGKSTIATNLAYQLSAMGGRVGLLDVDVYGPSLPLLVKPDDATVRQSPPSDISSGDNNNETTSTMVEPIIHNNVKLMSLGYVSPNSGVPGSGSNSGAAVLRGPMAGRVVSQLLKGTNWGNLDVLVLDLPPGTGDVQLTICQSLQLSGAVAISTPSKLAWSDVTKGVEMFGELNVRTLAVVENMAYFECEGGGRHYPFGKTKYDDDGEEESAESSSSSSLANHYLPASSHVFHLPISSRVNDANDSGTPLCCIDDDGSTAADSDGNNTDVGGGGDEERVTFAKIANAISTDLLLLQHNQTPLSMRDTKNNSTSHSGKSVLTVLLTTEAEDGEEGTSLEFDVPFTQLSVNTDERNFTVRLFSNEGGYQKVISGRELKCRDPRTGDIVDDDASTAQHKGDHGGGCGSKEHRSHASTGQSSSSMVQQYTSSSKDSSTKQKDTLFPVYVTKKGSYGYEIEWADGSKIIYSLLAIAKAAGGKAHTGN